MKNRAVLLASIFLGALALPQVSTAQAQLEYRYTKIDVPHGSRTFPRGINAHGDILGGYVDANGVGHDFVLHNGVFSNVVYPGNAAAAARAINARGDLVGSVDEHAFLLHDGKLTKFDYPGASSTIAFGINNSGDVTGLYTTAAGEGRGFILREGKFHTISVPGGANVGLHGAQDNGQVMVGDELRDSDQSQRGFRLRPGFVRLMNPPGTIFPCSHARGINERGDVAGAFAIVNTADECNDFPPTHGFVLRDDTYDVIDFPGAHNNFVFGINDDGAVVGVFVDDSGNIHGFMATPRK